MNHGHHKMCGVGAVGSIMMVRTDGERYEVQGGARDSRCGDEPVLRPVGFEDEFVDESALAHVGTAHYEDVPPFPFHFKQLV